MQQIPRQDAASSTSQKRQPAPEHSNTGSHMSAHGADEITNDSDSECSAGTTQSDGREHFDSSTPEPTKLESPTADSSSSIPSTHANGHAKAAANPASADRFGSAARMVHQQTLQTLSSALVWRQAADLPNDHLLVELEARLAIFAAAERQSALQAAERRFEAISSLAGMQCARERAMEAIRQVTQLAKTLETLAGGSYVMTSSDFYDLARRMGI